MEPKLNLTPLQTAIGQVTNFIDFLVPFVFAIALVVFIWGVFTYFILGGASEEKRDSGKQLVIWAIIGFVIMVSVWGIVNIITFTLGIQNQNRPCLPTFKGPCTSSYHQEAFPQTLLAVIDAK